MVNAIRYQKKNIHQPQVKAVNFLTKNVCHVCAKLILTPINIINKEK